MEQNVTVADLGAPLGGGFFAGEMTINGVRYALVVAPKAEGEKMAAEYKKKDRNTADGTDSDDDGFANCERINDANHPAAQFCRSLKAGGFDGTCRPGTSWPCCGATSDPGGRTHPKRSVKAARRPLRHSGTGLAQSTPPTPTMPGS